MGWFKKITKKVKNFLFGKKPEVRTGELQTPLQKRAFEELLQYARGRIGQGLPRWEGSFTAGFLPEQEKAKSYFEEALTGELPSVLQKGLGAYEEALEPVTYEDVTQWYENLLAPKRRLELEEEVLPAIREEYAKEGLLYGSPRYEAVAKARARDFVEEQALKAQLLEQEKARQLQALQMLPSIGMLPASYRTQMAQNLFNIAEQERQIKQADISARIAEFIRTTPELNPLLNVIKEMSTTPTQYQYTVPGTKGLLGSGGKFNPFQTIATIGSVTTGNPLPFILSQMSPEIGSAYALQPLWQKTSNWWKNVTTPRYSPFNLLVNQIEQGRSGFPYMYYRR